MQVPTELMREIFITLKLARIYIDTKESMNRDGIVLYDNLIHTLSELPPNSGFMMTDKGRKNE